MPLDFRDLKMTITNTLRARLYPECLKGDIETTLSTTINTSVAQSFIPFSKCYSKRSPYSYTIPVAIKLKKYGTPDDGVKVSLQSSSDGLPSGIELGSATIPASSVSTSLSTVSTNIAISDILGSKTEYWLVVDPLNTPSTINYYSLARNSVDTDYWMGTAYSKENGGTWSALNMDIYFDIGVKNWIYPSYPREDLSLANYPRIAVDIIGKPRVVQKWIDRKLAEYYLTLAITAYSQYPDELDDIISYVERTLWSSRVSIDNVKRLDPADITPTIVVTERLYSKAARYSLIYRMVADY
jgi:hypothetical protein